MTKQDLQQLIVECLHEYAADNASKQKANSMTLKKSELKALVNEVVRQCVKEAGPQYKVRGKTSQLEQPGLRNKAREMQDDPQINEEFPPSNDTPEGGDFGGNEPSGTEMGGQEPSYDESEEIRLLKGMGMIVLKLLKMHQGEDEGEVGGEPPTDDSVPFKGPEAAEKEEPETPEAPAASEKPKKKEDEIDENHKVQARSFKTVKDSEGNHPERTRKSSTPMS